MRTSIDIAELRLYWRSPRLRNTSRTPPCLLPYRLCQHAAAPPCLPGLLETFLPISALVTGNIPAYLYTPCCHLCHYGCPPRRSLARTLHLQRMHTCAQVGLGRTVPHQHTLTCPGPAFLPASPWFCPVGWLRCFCYIRLWFFCILLRNFLYSSSLVPCYRLHCALTLFCHATSLGIYYLPSVIPHLFLHVYYL